MLTGSWQVVYSHIKQSKCRPVTQWKLLGIVFATLSLTQLIPFQLELAKHLSESRVLTHIQMLPVLSMLDE